MLPFAVLLATYGFGYLLSLPKKFRLLTVSVFYLAIILQFVFFLSDYFTNYPARVYGWFNYNIPGALEAVLEEQNRKKSDFVYLDNKIHFIEKYWQFFLKKNKREELTARTVYFDPNSPKLPPLLPNSLLLYRFDNIGNQPTADAKLSLVKYILEPDRITSFYLYYFPANQ